MEALPAVVRTAPAARKLKTPDETFAPKVRTSSRPTADEITELHTWGWKMETSLQPVLEDHLGESLVKTARRYDSVDFLGSRYQVELKCRRAKDKYGNRVVNDTYGDWLVPETKIVAAKRNTQMRSTIFYYFEGDETLWQIWVDEIDWSKIPCFVPGHHTEYHYHIPRELWTKVEGDYGLPW